MSDKQRTSFADEHRFYILGSFNDETKENVIVPLTKKIDELSKVKDASIDFYINSHGGDANVVMHITSLFELAKKKGIKVRTFVPYIAFSAGSMLAIAGTKGERYVAKSAEHLIHYGSIQGWAKYTPTQNLREAEFIKRHFSRLLDHYNKYSSVPNLEEHIKDDNFFINSAKCIRWGLADKYMEDFGA